MRIGIIILLCLSTHFLSAQDCNGPGHSLNMNDSWISCSEAQSPNAVRGNSHWIMYDLGYTYGLGSTRIWNYNGVGNTDNGMKKITIDGSVDGTNWTELSSWALTEATGLNGYKGESGPDLVGMEYRYLLITSQETWGGDCAGLSEVRFDISETVGLTEHESSHLHFSLFPNPTSDILQVKTERPFDEMIVINSAGLEVYRAQYNRSVDISFLPNGMYFLRLQKNGGLHESQRFIKLSKE